mgnify:CR=1 FL=1
MLKTISAALFAVSVLAAPALAAGASHATSAVTKSVVVGGQHVNPHVLNAQARMHKHRTVRPHRHFRMHRIHKPIVMHRGHRH